MNIFCLWGISIHEGLYTFYKRFLIKPSKILAKHRAKYVFPSLENQERKQGKAKHETLIFEFILPVT